MKTIQDIIGRLDKFRDDDVIYARPPWSIDSEADVKNEPEDGLNPFESQGLEYFLEVDIAKDVLDSMVGASLEDRCLRIIKYKTNDA